MKDQHDRQGGRAQRQRAVELLTSLDSPEGVHPAAVPGVELWRASATIPRHPVVYAPKIVLIGQGHKIGHLGGRTYRYDADHYLVLTVPLPFECETHASPDHPLLGVTVSLDPPALGEILLAMDEVATPGNDPGMDRGIFSTPLTSELSDSVVRLLECLHSPLDSRVLGPSLAREVIYRVLCGAQGGALRALASRNEQFNRIARVLRRIHAEYDRPLTTEELARDAGMSLSVFHHNFKRVTAASPLQYVKQVKLHHARTLMAHEGLNAGSAAARVGYESASQFGREFKRLFGVPPARSATTLRQRLTTLPPSTQPDGDTDPVGARRYPTGALH